MTALPMGTGRLQVGVDPLNNGICPFLNWARLKPNTSLFANLTKTDNSTIVGTALFDQGRVDANYDLIDISSCKQYNMFVFSQAPASTGNLKADVNQYNLVVTWEDTGGVTNVISGGGLNSLVVNVAAKRATFKINAGVASAGIGWSLNAALGGGPTNIKIFRAEYESLLNAGRIMDPDWLAWYARECGRLRLMDECVVNGSLATSITDIPTLDYKFWSSALELTSGQKAGWPIEAFVEIANLTGLQIWVNIPHLMDDAGVTAIAQKYKDGIEYLGTEPRVIFAISNETWNTQFSQTSYYQAQGAAQGWTTGGATNKGCQYYGYDAAKKFELIRAVFGTDSGNKWAGVIETQAVQPALATACFAGMTRHITNDGGVPVGTTIAKLVSFLAVQSYFGQTFIGAKLPTYAVANMQAQWALVSTENFIQLLYDALKPGGTKPTADYWGACDELTAYVVGHKAVADANGVGMTFYEGGLHGQISNPLLGNLSGEIYGTLLEAAYTAFSNDPRCAQLQYDWFEQLIALTGGKPSQFVAVTTYRSGSFFCGHQTMSDYARERGNACQAVNLGLPFRQGKRNMRLQLTAS
jgi:hypothetical protein